MADSEVSQPCSQWWRRSPNACCSKKILLLLMWNVLFNLSWSALPIYNIIVVAFVFFKFSFAPFIGWLADVRLGRYEIIQFGSAVSLLASFFYYFAVLNASTLSTVLMSISIVVFGFDYTCYSAAMLPFITDQIIGATSDELGSVVRWYIWAQYLGLCLSFIIHVH